MCPGHLSPDDLRTRLFGRASRTRFPGALSGYGLSRARLRARSTGASSGRVSRARLPGAPPCRARLWARLLGAPPNAPRLEAPLQARPGRALVRLRDATGASPRRVSRARLRAGRVSRRAFWARAPWRASRARLTFKPSSFHITVKLPRSSPGARLFGRASRARSQATCVSGRVSWARLPVCRARLQLVSHRPQAGRAWAGTPLRRAFSGALMRASPGRAL